MPRRAIVGGGRRPDGGRAVAAIANGKRSVGPAPARQWNIQAGGPTGLQELAEPGASLALESKLVGRQAERALERLPLRLDPQMPACGTGVNGDIPGLESTLRLARVEVTSRTRRAFGRVAQVSPQPVHAGDLDHGVATAAITRIRDRPPRVRRLGADRREQERQGGSESKDSRSDPTAHGSDVD